MLSRPKEDGPAQAEDRNVRRPLHHARFLLNQDQPSSSEEVGSEA